MLQRAYRLLVNMHENCAQLVAAVEDTGHLSRELEELQDLVSFGALTEMVLSNGWD